MIDHYNAFISYRHADRDIKAAKAIQSDLEHFHIPRKIRKITGQSKINRIFLDKDELGAASDLSSEITYALEHADHLIVICSTATSQSLWVPREIQTFLKNHTRNQITTVLVDGEPEEVIPELLKYEDRTYENINGNTYTIRVPLEPLSCDYRLPRKKAKKEELPRLASKLLGCSYDELMNRRRAYKVRRLSIIFSALLAVVLGFVGYLLYSRNRIQENLQSSLRNQSIYLANESLYSLENEQRILALQLALESMPKDENDSRPVTPQSIRALSDSTLAYITRYGYGIHTNWNYRSPDYIRKGDCALSSTGHELVAWDKGGNVTLWNTTTHETILSQNFMGMVNTVQFLPDGKMLVLMSDKAFVYRIQDGSEAWVLNADGYYFSSGDIPVFSDNSILLATSDSRLLRLRLSDGSVMATYQLPKELDGKSLDIAQILLSPDEKRIALTSLVGFSSHMLLVYEIPSNTTHHLKDLSYITDMIWGDDSHLILSTPAETFNSSGVMDGVTRLRTDHVAVRCYDSKTLNELWNYDFTSNNVMRKNGFVSLPKNEAVCYYHANQADIIHIADGSPVAKFNTNDSIVLVQDPDGDGWPFFVTESGNLVFPVSTDTVQSTPYFADDADDVFFKSGIGFFVHRSNTPEILHYGMEMHDEEWTELEAGKEMKTLERSYMDDKVFAVISNEPAKNYPGEAPADAEDIEILTIIDPRQGKLQYQIPLTDDGMTNSDKISLLGTSGSHFYIGYVPGLQGYRIMDLDLSTGETKTIDIAEEEYVAGNFCTLSDGKLYYCAHGEEFRYQLYTYDLSTGETASYKISDDMDVISVRKPPIVLPFINSVYITTSKESVIVSLDGAPTKYLTLPEDWEEKMMAFNLPDQQFAVSDKKSIRLTKLDGSESITIPCPVEPYGFTFYNTGEKDDPTQLLVIYGSGSLYRYDAATGTLLGKTEMTLPTSTEPGTEFTFDRENKLMYVQVDDTLGIIETDTWYEETFIKTCMGHHAPTDRIYSYSRPSSSFTIGYFRHYTTDELIKKARDYLQGAEMSDEEKSEYGLYDTP